MGLERGWEVERGVLEAYLGFLLWKPEADGLAQQVPGSAGAPRSSLSSEHAGSQIAGLRRDSLLPDRSRFSQWGRRLCRGGL